MKTIARGTKVIVREALPVGTMVTHGIVTMLEIEEREGREVATHATVEGVATHILGRIEREMGEIERPMVPLAGGRHIEVEVLGLMGAKAIGPEVPIA